MDDLFKGRHFEREIIALCGRWYLRFQLSLRDLVEMMTERGIVLVHTTIMRWVQRFVPEFEKRWNRSASKAGRSWRVDETYVKIRGKWTYLYRAVDQEGQTVDFRLSANRDVKATKAFFRKPLKSQEQPPVSFTLDGYAASHRAVLELPAQSPRWKDTRLRSSRYLNKMAEQDHRGVKSRKKPMLGFKVFDLAAGTIAGVELLHRIRKGQFNLGRLRIAGQAAPAIWTAVHSPYPPSGRLAIPLEPPTDCTRAIPPWSVPRVAVRWLMRTITAVMLRPSRPLSVTVSPRWNLRAWVVALAGSAVEAYQAPSAARFDRLARLCPAPP